MSASLAYDLDLDLSPEVLSTPLRRRSATARLAGSTFEESEPEVVAVEDTRPVAPARLYTPWL